MALRIARETRSGQPVEERERDLREDLAARADELWTDYVKPRDGDWDCPACAQVDRIQGRREEESA